MRKTLRQHLAELTSPMAFAAYAAWAAVWLAAGDAMARGPLAGWSLRIALLLFLLLFMYEHLVLDRLGRRGFFVLGAVLALLALGVTAATPHGASPILLVLLAAVLAARLEWRELLFLLVPINLGLAAVVFGFWPGRSLTLLITLFAFASFQMFAALVMRYAAQAEAMSERLRAVNAELVATRSLLEESARDAERLRLSRELHDVAGHALTALKLNLGALARDPAQPDPERVRLCAGLADDLLQDLRAMVRQMRDHEGIDLRLAIERLAAPFPRPKVQLDLAEDARVADLDSAEALLRAVQEGLTNAARHSAAEHLWLSLRRAGDRLELELRDDGRRGAQVKPGNGLQGMRERLRSLGGDLAIDRGAEGGVRLSAWIPALSP